MALAVATEPLSTLSQTAQGPEWRIENSPLPYDDALTRMEARVAAIRAGKAPELIWLVEHPPLFTAGTSARAEDLLNPLGLPTFRTGRGGQWTWHGPGQRVGYVLLDLRARGLDVRCYVRALEAWLIAALDRLGVRAERREGRVGLWVPDRRTGREAKIAAIGVRVTRWVTWHGFALNVDPDLSFYRGIVPCGLKDYGVTSLAALGITASLAEVDSALIATFAEAFGRPSPCPG